MARKRKAARSFVDGSDCPKDLWKARDWWIPRIEEAFAQAEKDGGLTTVVLPKRCAVILALSEVWHRRTKRDIAAGTFRPGAGPDVSLEPIERSANV